MRLPIGRHPGLVLLAGLLLCCGCDRAPAAASAGPAAVRPADSRVPTVKVDAQHELREQGTAGTPYVLEGASGLMIDASKFTLRDPQRRARVANSVQVIYDNSLFTARWPASGRQVSALDRSTLKVVRGAEFQGFKPGTQAYIAIGNTAPGDGAEPQFTPFWMTSVIFR